MPPGAEPDPQTFLDLAMAAGFSPKPGVKLDNVDPRLAAILPYISDLFAGQQFPERMITSGTERPPSRRGIPSFHPGGQAIDLRTINQQTGQPLSLDVLRDIIQQLRKQEALAGFQFEPESNHLHIELPGDRQPTVPGTRVINTIGGEDLIHQK